MLKDLLPLQKELIGAMIGLAKACYIHEKKQSTDAVIVRGLATIKRTSDTSITLDMLRKVQAEKKLVAPGCSTCMSPCGNTNDYDLNEVIHAEQEIFQEKDKLLEAVVGLADHVDQINHSEEVGQEEREQIEKEISLIYRGLSVISYDVPVERIQTVVNQLHKQLAQ